MSIKLKIILDQILKEAEEKEFYSKEEVIDYIKNHPPVKYYRIGVGQGVSRDLRDDAEAAIELVQKSGVNKYKLSRYGQVIQFSLPFDEKHADLVRSMGSLDEDIRFDFKNTSGGGGRRFIPNQGIIPSSMFNDKDFMLSNDGTKLYMDPLLVNAIVNSKTLTNRAAQVRYQEFKEKMGPHFQQFKKGLEGRLSKVLKNGKPFDVWNGTVMTNKKGQIAFPYSDIGTIAENEN